MSTDQRYPVKALYQQHHLDNKEFGGNRLYALERDGYACVICGMTNEEHFDRWNCNITVDHIDGQGRGRAAPNSVLENLQTLCLSCHGKKDSIRADYSLRNTASGERHGMAKLTFNQVREIRACREDGLSLRNIAIMYDTSISNVSSICTYRIWKDDA